MDPFCVKKLQCYEDHPHSNRHQSKYIEKLTSAKIKGSDLALQHNMIGRHFRAYIPKSDSLVEVARNDC